MGSSRASSVAGVLAAAVLLTGCSIDTIIWGPEGAEVIRTTERLIDDVSESGGSDLICEGAEVRLGESAFWSDRSAGEPERFAGELWPEGIPVPDAEWQINVEGHPEHVVSGDEIPGDVFFRDATEGLCVVHVEWVTIEFSD